ncbi:MAG: hypothetical protein IKX80_09430, partial [Lachnospiraceae bacterium]|nr:hypothetical protein [Lachnospiraceae bacterium]
KNASTLTASYLGVPQDVPKLYFTVSFGGKVIDPTDSAYTNLIEIGTSDVGFIPFKMGGKLPKGTYTVTVYKLIPKDNGSAVIKLGSKDITVIESEPDTAFSKIATEASGSLPAVLGNCFKLYYEGTEVTASITSADYTGPDSNSGAVYVRSITVGGLYSSAYGSFSVQIPVGELVYIK